MGKYFLAILTFVIPLGFSNWPNSFADSLSDNLVHAIPSQRIEIPENLSPAQGDAVMATLSDEQVRSALAQELKQDVNNEEQNSATANATRQAGRQALIFYEMEEQAALAAESISSSFSRMGSSGEK